MGTFDPSTFLDVSFDESVSPTVTPCPEGDYTAVAGEPKLRDWVSKKDNSAGQALDIPWEIDDTHVKEVTKRDKIIVTQGIMLNFNAAGGLDKDNNPAIGQLREAVGLNKPGVPFSFRMIQGQVAKVKIKHRMYEGNVFADVKGVTKL